MFENLMGRRQGELAPDPLTRRGCDLWLDRVLGWYGEDGGVDVEIIDGQLLLTPQTAAYLYSSFTDLHTEYKAGTRPFLERHLADHVTHATGKTALPAAPGASAGPTERERALAIMRLVRDTRDFGLKGRSGFDGGTEEELIKRGASMCNELSRLFCCLCQIAGLGARFVGHHISGHATVEVRVDGRWWWMDPQKGLYVVDAEDRPMSAWEILQDPTIFERQPLSMWEDCRPLGPISKDGRDEVQRAYFMAKCRDCYFNPREAVCIGNYYVWEHARYTYPWRNEAADPARLARARREEALNRAALNWPLYYHNHLLFNEPFKHR
jgi:CubicO group peptidase (beta-lactamase class C family)